MMRLLLALSAFALSCVLTDCRSSSPRWLQRPLPARLLAVRGGAAEGAEGISVRCSLRGKKYELTATSVEDITRQIEDQAGLEVAKQSVLFKGRVLPADALLADEGVADGDSLSIVAQTKAKASSPAAGAAPAAAADAATGGDDLSALLKAAGGAGGAGGIPGMPDLGAMGDPAQMQKMMGEMLNSPMMKELFEDPEKIEMTRQMMLSNPMLKPMLDAVPGMSEIINDKEKWRQHMQDSLAEIQRMQTQGGGAGDFSAAGATQAEEELVDDFDDVDDF